MSVYRITAAYAKSLMHLSKEKNALDQVYNDLVFTASVCKENKEFTNLLNSPIVSLDKKLAIINKIFQGKVSDFTLKFFNLILRKKREQYIPYIADGYILEYKTQKNIVPVTIVLAQNISDHLKGKIVEKAGLGKDKTIDLTTIIDPAIIGGFILKADDLQMDSSVKTKLNSIKNTIL